MSVVGDQEKLVGYEQNVSAIIFLLTVVCTEKSLKIRLGKKCLRWKNISLQHQALTCDLFYTQQIQEEKYPGVLVIKASSFEILCNLCSHFD